MGSRGRKFALIIGNGGYSGKKMLPTPPKDAAAMSKALSELEFEVTTETDLGRDAINAAIRNFIARLPSTTAEMYLFYYSGHGVEYEGQNYLVPIDFDRIPGGCGDPAEQTASPLIRVQGLIDELFDHGSARIIFLDACRTGGTLAEKEAFDREFRQHLIYKSIEIAPNRRTILVGGEVQPKLVAMEGRENTFIAFATASGQAAIDTVSGENSPF